MTAPSLAAPDRHWQPDLYLRYAEYRARPARDLLHRIPDCAPRLVVDLGCGPGNITPELIARWPQARILGVDNAPSMLARARERELDAEWVLADAAVWTPPEPADVIFSNAALQWLPDHEALFPALMHRLAPGGVLAVQMPTYAAARSLALVHDVAETGPWARRLAGRLRVDPVARAGVYYDLLSPLAAELDLWETVYQHRMADPDDIVTWNEGTALLPVREVLDAEDYAAFVADFRRAVRDAYPRQRDSSVLFPFRRLFIVARRAAGTR